MLFCACECACWPLTCVMVVGVWCLGWCCFQWRVAVVWASRCVPGVFVGFGVLVVCFGVVWLVVGACGACARVVGASVGVSWLVCVLWWFRMLTCSGLFLFLGFVFCFVLLFG